MPHPANTLTNNPSTTSFFEYLWGGIDSYLEMSINFLVQYLIIIFIILCIFGILYFVLYRFHKQKLFIKKLWLYTLFFLTKRQMMIPLVYTLAKKDHVNKYKDLDALLRIRERCKHLSLKKSPVARLKEEKEISQFLYDYFTDLEERNLITKKSKFEYIVRDLEFIDQKLVELQKLYNIETSKWNRTMTIPVMKYFFRIFNLRTFEKFETTA